APVPTAVRRRNGAGADGSDRITAVWPDGVVRNRWLRVTVKADDRSLLPRDDVFYFGNLIGETGDSPTTLRVTALDLSATRRAVMTTRGSVDIENPFDMDRSGTLTVSVDLSVVRANQGRSLPARVAPAVGP